MNYAQQQNEHYKKQESALGSSSAIGGAPARGEALGVTLTDGLSALENLLDVVQGSLANLSERMIPVLAYPADTEGGVNKTASPMPAPYSPVEDRLNMMAIRLATLKNIIDDLTYRAKI